MSIHESIFTLFTDLLQRVALLETWKSFEETHGTPDDVAKVQAMMPIVSKRRHVDQETGQAVEDWDLVFADDEREANPTSFKFLQMAHAWKARSVAAGSGGESSGILSSLLAAASSSGVGRGNRRADDMDDEDDEDSDASSSRVDDDR